MNASFHLNTYLLFQLKTKFNNASHSLRYENVSLGIAFKKTKSILVSSDQMFELICFEYFYLVTII